VSTARERESLHALPAQGADIPSTDLRKYLFSIPLWVLQYLSQP
jgi:hypothetical protein